MKDLTPEQIQVRYDKLPQELKDALSSPDVHAAIQRIGRDKGLMIDQMGELVDQVGLVILGFAKASDFVTDTAKRLSIDESKAREIAGQINNDILSAIRRSIQSNAESAEKESAVKDDHISTIEKAGDFEIERPIKTALSSRTDAGEGDNLEERHEIMSGIEDPQPAVPRLNTIKPPVVPVVPSAEQPKTEPLVEQLLRSGSAMPEQKVVRSAPEERVGSSANNKTQPKSGVDPYREAIE